MKTIFALFAVLFLFGCENVPIENQIYATKSALIVAQRGALGYVEQPLCNSPEAFNSTICSEPSIIKKIKIADNSAMTAIAAAEEARTEESLAIAQTAFKALLEITSGILAEK